MEAKDKAEELVKKMRLGWLHTGSYFMGKQCALIAIAFAKENPLNTDGYNKYLNEVEQEINKL